MQSRIFDAPPRPAPGDRIERAAVEMQMMKVGVSVGRGRGCDGVRGEGKEYTPRGVYVYLKNGTRTSYSTVHEKSWRRCDPSLGDGNSCCLFGG